MKKIVPEFGEDPFKELDDVWQELTCDEKKKIDKNAGSLLLRQMH
jgi:hypothetical protein